MKAFLPARILIMFVLFSPAFSVRSQITLDLKVYLEGPWGGVIMSDDLNDQGLIPLNQPYFSHPWYYFGNESVQALPPGVIDWVLIELRESSGDAASAKVDSTIFRRAAFIFRNGKIVDLDGTSLPQCNVDIHSNLYLVIRHRNHLDILSAFPLQASGTTYTYDFSTGADKVFGGNLGHKEIGANIWGKIGADGNADGQVNSVDKNDVWKQQAGTSGYLAGDFDLNGQVQTQDKLDIWLPNGGRSSQVPGYGSGNTNPVAVLQVTPPAGSTNTIFQLDGSGSHDTQTKSSLLAVRWDYTGDGTWDTPWSYTQTTTYHFMLPGVYTIKMEVMDLGGLTGLTTVSTDVVIGVGCEGVDTVNYAGKTYHALEIGKQCWLKENLDLGTKIDGSQNQINNSTIEKYCYDNNPANCDTYGGLYIWDEMMNYSITPGGQGICPIGWHVPLDVEWKVLEGNVDSKFGVGDPEWGNLGWLGYDVGGKLKEPGFIHWNSPNTGANDQFDFSALGGGYFYNGSFYGIKNYGHYWSSTLLNTQEAWDISFAHNTMKADFDHDLLPNAFSVRCLRDNINLPPGEPMNPVPSNGAINIDIPNLSWSCSDPNGDIVQYTLYFGTVANPPILASKQAYSHYTVPSLSANTLYRWRIVVTDMHGDSISGPVWSFTTGSFICGTNLTDTRPGGGNQVYPTVLIGNQCWMKKNINYGAMVFGNEKQTNNQWPEKYCFGDNAVNCGIYGGLYQWDEMMNYVTVQGAQGICPVDWHIPTDQEWKTLEGIVDSQHMPGDPGWDINGWRGFDAGGNLKDATTTYWSAPNTGATNSSGFTAFGGGQRTLAGAFSNLTTEGHFWSSNENGVNALTRGLHYLYAESGRDDMGSKSFGFSVRCLKNFIPSNQPPSQPTDPNPPDISTNQPLSIELSWTCSDPEGDVLSYDIYLETDTIPVLVKADHIDISFNPGLLQANKTYYWKVVARDSHGNYTPGDLWSFQTAGEWACGSPLADPRDNQVYNTVQIGAQCWMAENLNIGAMIPGANDQANNGTIEKYCYNDNSANCDEYGGLYQWNEMMQYSTTPGISGICPGGWHLPTDSEWCTLEQFLDPTITCNSTGWRGIDGGGKMKEIGALHWLEPNVGATNSSGFTALGGGYRFIDGTFIVLSIEGTFWSSTENGMSAWGQTLGNSQASVGRYSSNKVVGFSTRCIKDEVPILWSCGESLTVTHIAGEVAPVNKTVNYGTVETNLTGSNKCWITQNLGSDRQALSATDASEESSGWYWQFNRKQGYKHDGSTITPSWTITSINENNDWLSSNDPCNLLLGTNWRLPTYTEWYNADMTGGWEGYNQTFASILKLHTAGYLDNSSGALNYRGSDGYYWSNMQFSTTNGWYLAFGSAYSYMDGNNHSKAFGFSTRCLKEIAQTWSCGQLLPVYHGAGEVAPVNKAVDYGTVLSNLTGSDKCWITQNLGSDHQATSATDATEASAGWYWQFNRKQGYKHDGYTATPDWTITSIDENSDWLIANDPCSFLLGTGWRLPTYTEWNNADNNGGWNNCYDAYASALKLHTAGYLNDMNGSIGNRGVSGYYWGSSQLDNSNAWFLFINNVNSTMNSNNKASGVSIRCLKDIQVTWSCGQPLPVYHGAGEIAPVNKAVDYGTVESNLTGSNKCWITQNLGSDHEATSATDNTEASAGWYWQFNWKQGYKHDGSARTPNTTWISSINESSDWLTVNDPCTLLLGNDWRLPTYTEWYSADVNGGWNNRTNTFNSVLKLHAAGHLNVGDGSLSQRGFEGKYWSSKQNGNISGWLLEFDGAGSGMFDREKAYGFSSRCLRDIQTTWSCGQPLPVNHVAGNIAPVTKNVNYGTIETNLTGSNKCWITQNLGSDRQALSATDATEESAGWYWQFNRKQGYKHDGITLTPGWNTTPINENSDWLIGNDPCASLLETGWRLPTYTEWYNADINGGWNNYNQTYASALKLHTAGNISDGYLLARGTIGYYWSGTQYSSTKGWNFGFIVINSEMYYNNKTFAFSVRCLRDIPQTWSCGQLLPVYHGVGEVAPVNKAVDYGTVVTNLTGSNKCWITQNLGADHQATSATDNTEASAGWYWQFNRKQGYKHDGTTLTPAWTITSISENIDWLTVNDPCSLLLGTDWRLPTYTELNNAVGNGSWNNYNQTFGSVLKLHAAGHIINSSGALNDRGIYGYYWSNNQNSNTSGWDLNFSGSYCQMDNGTKADGFSIRCLKDTQTVWSCGQPLPVFHGAGEIAPVNKSVDYGTVETDLTGSNKCWITQNLGSDHQALSANDDSEPSAGWYWQFNFKQGYKHDGSVRTPTTVWITSIDENSDWKVGNDPCKLLVGNGWRIPTYTEWYYADYINGGWNNYNNTYNSVLKIHAAGAIDSQSGNLGVRGINGYYWSSTQNSSLYAYYLDLDPSNSYMSYVNKANGYSIRCLIDISPLSWSCGQPLPVFHSAGEIAPVNKAVDYGTVETNLTGSNKCWITQNLGSDRQALSGTDATEESAGWYWQFNQKQGYKHDGTILTPAWTITSIDENSDWLSANDPCSLLLGTGWRLPTYTEWKDADVSGGWINYNDTFGSVLKLHAAGNLYRINGTLNDRGSIGFYWSSTQTSNTHGWDLYLNSIHCYTTSNYKTHGFSIRCLKD